MPRLLLCSCNEVNNCITIARRGEEEELSFEVNYIVSNEKKKSQPRRRLMDSQIKIGDIYQGQVHRWIGYCNDELEIFEV